MKRAKSEGKDPAQAAREYFLPKYYYDPERKDRKVANYFQGMDRIAVLPSAVSSGGAGTSEQTVDPLQAPVYQLLDKETPEHVIADPVLSNQEILGRNTWMIWCAGNEGFWDWLATDSLGFIDLLKVVDTRERSTRFRDAGLINEPGMSEAGSAGEFGLWLDMPSEESIAEWRRNYVEQAFEQIGDRVHESQRGQGDYRVSMEVDSEAMAYGREYADQYPMDAGKEAYRQIPPPEIYGLSSGVVGLRLFPNPKFDATAQKVWDADRYYSDPNYFNDPNLVRPYRVGMSCAFCHASFHPLFPPKDVTTPRWENISGNIGAQYLRIRAVFGNLLTKDQFVYHLLDSQPPGTIDTSLIASDGINNPNAINSVFNVPQRVLRAFDKPTESQSAASLSQPTVWSDQEFAAGEVNKQYLELIKNLPESNKNPRYVPHILLDGADSIGAWGALARVYLNIGTYYEQWIRIHRPVVGFQPQQSFTIDDCEKHSVYWHATQLRVGPLRDYFLKISPPMPLLATPGGTSRVDQVDEEELRQQAQKEGRDATPLVTKVRGRRIDTTKLAHGRRVFAENCIVCHSSIQPETGWAEAIVYGASETPEQKKREEQRKRIAERRVKVMADWQKTGELWEHEPGRWLEDPDYLAWAEAVVELPAFWQFNYLSTDYRVPINLVRTNAGRALATNALDTAMWDDFASESYQRMPSVGQIDFFDPYDGEHGAWNKFAPRHQVAKGLPEGGGGPGFYRVPTLVSIWTTAPLLHNNSLGIFNNDPSVNGRLDAFDDAIRKLLWPERRLESSSYNDATPERLKADNGLIWRTPQETYLTVAGKYVPAQAEKLPIFRTLREWRPSWVESVRPHWLPSALLLASALLLLSVEPGYQSRWWGVFVALVAIAAAALYFSRDAISWLGALERVREAWLPFAILVSMAVALLVLGFPKLVRPIGILALGIAGLSLVLRGLIGVRGGSSWLDDYLPLWLIGGLLVIGLLAFLFPDPKQLIRKLGYVSLAAALGLGLYVYFINGRLGDLRLGPIPKGTPVNLLTNLNSEAEPSELKAAIKTTIGTLAEIESKHLEEQEAQRRMREEIAPALMKVNKCPDFVMDRGHYFEWFNNMSDSDKEALIELLKTF